MSRPAERAGGLFTRAMGTLWHWPAVVDKDVEHVADLPVPMSDGAQLLADMWCPRGVSEPPTLLVRSPYGRRGLVGWQYGRALAHQGFRVVVVSCRGTGIKGQRFTEPFAREVGDGQDTVAWLRRQPWFDGRFATIGASYLGFVQLALAVDPPPELVAMVWQTAPTSAGAVIYPDGVLGLATALGWTQGVSGMSTSMLRNLLAMRQHARTFDEAVRDLPLATNYRTATGQAVGFFEDWLDHPDVDDPWWRASDCSTALDKVSVPVLVQGGWYDLFADDALDQYRRLRDRGVDVHLTMGPWTHGLLPAWSELYREAVGWLRAAFSGDRGALRQAPVRIQLAGVPGFRTLADWPPPDTRERAWQLHIDGSLDPSSPATEGELSYRYDPADPTPGVGGALLGRPAGPVDNGSVEARPDVLVFTSAVLGADLEIAGIPVVDLWFQSSLDYADVFVRLCDVHPDNRSLNIADRLVRLSPGGGRRRDPDGVWQLSVELSPIAARIARGHRLRLQVSSGAFPRFARNTGTGKPDGSADELVAAYQHVLCGPAHPTALRLPVLSPGG